MPTASAAVRGGTGSFATTYGASYSTSTAVPPTITARRSNSATRRSGPSNSHGSQVKATRPLPDGPGPLDRQGRRLDSVPVFSTDVTRRPKATEVTTALKTPRPGPLKADHSTGSKFNIPDRVASYIANAPFGGRRSRSSGLEPLAAAAGVGPAISGRRSASLASLRIADDSSSGAQGKHRAGSNDRTSQRPSSRRGNRPEEEANGASPLTVGQTSKPRDRDGGKVGLRNLGNTCFMNSVLQCLSNTRPLLEWCVTDGFTPDINTTTSSMKGTLVKAFVGLMKSLWKESASESYVSPNNFKTQIQKFAPRFMGYAQQDSQEFLRYLLEGIHEDVNRVKVKPKPITIDDNRLDSKNDRDKAKEYWNVYLTRDNSHIVDIFVGQLKSELKFAECGHRSVTFDPFWDLSLPIAKNRSDPSLDDCLRLFMKEEELEAEERPTCTKCKVRRSCTKSFSIQRFPRILVFHLKRFSQERQGRKISSLVDFPVKDLNLSDYSSEGSRKVTYDLYAVSHHSGGVHSGHYTAVCKNPYSGEWYTYNDTRVSPARSNQAVSSEAYLLFYELTSSPGQS